MNGIIQRNYAQWQTNKFATEYNSISDVYRRPREMTAADLGLVDELLDDKIGMEPNPLDGTRLWDNS